MSKHRKHDDIQGSSADASGADNKENQAEQASEAVKPGLGPQSPEGEEAAAMEIGRASCRERV